MRAERKIGGTVVVAGRGYTYVWGVVRMCLTGVSRFGGGCAGGLESPAALIFVRSKDRVSPHMLVPSSVLGSSPTCTTSPPRSFRSASNCQRVIAGQPSISPSITTGTRTPTPSSALECCWRKRAGVSTLQCARAIPGAPHIGGSAAAMRALPTDRDPSKREGRNTKYTVKIHWGKRIWCTLSMDCVFGQPKKRLSQPKCHLLLGILCV